MVAAWERVVASARHGLVTPINNTHISEDLYQKLKLETVKQYGGKKGDLRMAIEEAIKLWLK